MNLIRPSIRRLRPYVPGEQPAVAGLVKLNTNENPYPPSARVLSAVKQGVDGRLRLYPNPSAERLRRKLAALHDCSPDQVIVGNGSDELLALATRIFVEPQGAFEPGFRESRPSVTDKTEKKVSLVTSTPTPNRLRAARCASSSASVVQWFVPSYSLYPVLAAIHGAAGRGIPLPKNFALPSPRQLKSGGLWDFRAALSFVTTPHAPSGRGYRASELRRLCEAHEGIIVFDEAYVDFGGESAIGLAREFPHVLVARTFSKGYSLCFLRIGYFVGPADLVAALHKGRDSYNVNGLAQIAAEATLDDLPYYRKNFGRIARSRARLASALTNLGFEIYPSQTNFILVRPPQFTADRWLKLLADQQILVRWFDQPETRDYLRITIGTEEEVKRLLAAVGRILS